MSTFTKLRDAIEDFVTSGFHKIADFFKPVLEQAAADLKDALPQIGEVAVKAALGSIASGGDKEAAYQAAKNAAISKAKELGIQEADTLANSLRTVALNATTQAAAQTGPNASGTNQ